jgi:hypothetical protein
VKSTLLTSLFIATAAGALMVPAIGSAAAETPALVHQHPRFDDDDDIWWGFEHPGWFDPDDHWHTDWHCDRHGRWHDDEHDRWGHDDFDRCHYRW